MAENIAQFTWRCFPPRHPLGVHDTVHVGYDETRTRFCRGGQSSTDWLWLTAQRGAEPRWGGETRLLHFLLSPSPSSFTTPLFLTLSLSLLIPSSSISIYTNWYWYKNNIRTTCCMYRKHYYFHINIILKNYSIQLLLAYIRCLYISWNNFCYYTIIFNFFILVNY